MSAKKRCPDCQKDDGLATIENVQGLAECESISADGPVWKGYTEMLFDTSETIGVACDECGWQYEGQDWMDKLLS